LCWTNGHRCGRRRSGWLRRRGGGGDVDRSRIVRVVVVVELGRERREIEIFGHLEVVLEFVLERVVQIQALKKGGSVHFRHLGPRNRFSIPFRRRRRRRHRRRQIWKRTEVHVHVGITLSLSQWCKTFLICH